MGAKSCFLHHPQYCTAARCCDDLGYDNTKNTMKHRLRLPALPTGPRVHSTDSPGLLGPQIRPRGSAPCPGRFATPISYLEEPVNAK